jgi:hypothetical protein
MPLTGRSAMVKALKQHWRQAMAATTGKGTSGGGNPWRMTGAVGIIGSESNPGNLIYLAVVAIALLGSIVAFGRPAAMAWAMGFTAIVEVLAPVIAYAALADPAGDVLKPEVFTCAVVFAGMWVLSALLFRKAARRDR